MWYVALLVVASCGACAGHSTPLDADDLSGTELLYTYVVFRHGDRTPELVELAAYPNAPENITFYPYGYGALTNTGKRRASWIGEYLRSRYGDFLERVYEPSQVTVNCTDLDRTKMTALSALAAWYPPTQLQRWSAELSWQPIPYSVQDVPSDACTSYYYVLMDEILASDEVAAMLAPYAEVFEELTALSGTNTTSAKQVTVLQGVIQGLQNYGIPPPAWYNELSAVIDQLVALQFGLFYYTDSIIRVHSGPLLYSFLETAESVMASGVAPSPRLRALSAHDWTVGAMMAAARVFYPHRPKYSATFSLELRRNLTSGEYGVAAVYKQDASAAAPERVLRVPGCGGSPLCDYSTFVQLTKDVVLAPEDVAAVCST